MAVEFHHATLANGLTIIAEADPEAHSAAVGMFVRTGARDEAPEVMGVSHFLEHMMFKGTAKRTAEDVNRDFDAIGARYNAYTSSEVTCFHAQVLPERLSEATEILADILRPALRDPDFESERGVILEEMAMYKDNPFWVLYEAVSEKRYGAHPLGHRVLGTPDTVGSMTPAQMRAYFEQRYSADNAVLALAGAVDFEKSVEELESLCGGWATTKPQRDHGEVASTGGEVTLTDERINRAYMIALSPAPGIQDERRYAARMLSSVLGAPANSRLHWALIETGIAEEAEAAYDAHDHAGDMFVYASCAPDRLAQVREIMDREIGGLVESLTEKDLELLRNRIATAATLAGERPEGRMQRIGRLWTYLRGWTSLEEELGMINAVTLDDLRAVFEEFPFEPRTVGTLTPA